MQIDWFTFVAQIINFLILIALLRYFLYRPILNAMDEREQKIADHLNESERKEQEAQQELETYQAKRQQIDEQREQLLAEAREAAQARRKELMEQMRQEVENTRKNWHDALQQEQEDFLQAFRERAGEQFVKVVRRTLQDLANVALEHQVIETFLNHLQDLSNDEKLRFTEALRDSDENATVYSAFELAPDRQDDIKQQIKRHLGDSINLNYETTPDLICGIAVQANGYQISWNITDYLDILESRLADSLQEIQPKPDVQQKVASYDQTTS